MPIRIVDNKKLNMTDDEFTLYNKIVQSYTVNNNNGQDLFKGLFETDKDGLIIFLIPPSVRQTSMEVWMFLMALQQQQQLRKIRELVNDEISQIKKILKDLSK